MVRASPVWKQLPEEVKLPIGPQANGAFLLSHQLYLFVLPIDTASLSTNRVVIKRRGPEISPGYYECDPRLLLLENRRKIEPKEIPSCLIPRLLVVFSRQLEILVTTLTNVWKSTCGMFYILFFCIVVSRPWLHDICISNCSYQSTTGLPFRWATSTYQVSTNPLMKYNISGLYPISREAEYFYSQPSCKLPPRMQRVSGHLWRVVAYDIRTVGGNLEGKVQTHLCFEENVLHAIVTSQIYIVNPCCFLKLFSYSN